MKTVFISHVSEDKARLTPYLDMILEKDLNNIKIWVDRPRGIAEGKHFKHDNCELVSGIEIGDKWDDAIEDALKDVDAVIAFWSQHASKKQSYVYSEEIYYARTKGKLVAVSLDRLSENPFLYGVLQVADIAEYGDEAFSDALKRMQRLFDKGPIIDGDEPSLEPSRLPYLADRERNAALISRQVSKACRIGHYIVPCSPSDVLDKFTWRIAEVDGPKIWAPDGTQTPETWSYRLVQIDSSDSIEGQREEIELILQESIEHKAAFEDNILRNRPVILHGEFRAELIGAECLVDWIEMWIETTEACIDHYDSAFAQQGTPKTPICTILAIFSDPLIDAKLFSDLPDNFGSSVARPCRPQKIKRLNFQSWLNNEEIRKAHRNMGLNLGELERNMEAHFVSDNHQYSMEDFVGLCQSCPTWENFLASMSGLDEHGKSPTGA